MESSMSTDSSAGQERRHTGRRDVRIQIVCDDQLSMNMAATVNLSDDGVLIAAGVELEEGTPVAIFPLADDMDDANLFELKGEVVRTFEDIMVSAYADNRFLMGIQLDLSAQQREALRKYIESHKN